MENASKALIMAGGILIGILILSLTAYLFVDFGSTSAEIIAQNNEKQITEFNSRFTSYQEYKDKEGNWQITIYDIISLSAFVKENNKYYEEEKNEKISVKIDNIEIQENSTSQNEMLIKKYVNSNGTLVKFKCNKIDYNNNGKVKQIVFLALN